MALSMDRANLLLGYRDISDERTDCLDFLNPSTLGFSSRRGVQKTTH